MLPLQITLEGFMSYRDKTTISFQGASLWMLAGGNGAGKSTVFDAMRWTLFGAHRGGRSGHEALIHRDREKLRVAFDLALGDEHFRLIRTLSRANRSTWQIEKLNGEEVEKIPETDGREGYEKWGREHIGMSDETFCAAMYLAQGRGDAILSASPNQRYEMLREIVDISSFVALHERAKTRAQELEIAARESEKSWQRAPDVEDKEIEVLGEKLAQLGAQISQNSARREEVLQLLPLAAHWQELESRRQNSQKSLDTARDNLLDAPQIERDFARLCELEALLPPLGKLVAIRERAAQNASETQTKSADLQVAREKLSHIELDLQRAQIQRDALENAQKSLENVRFNAITVLADLAPQLADARQIAQYEREIADLETQLAAFPADLGEQIRALEIQIERAQNQKIAAQILVRFAREKAVFQDAQSSKATAQNEIARLEIALNSTTVEVRISSDSLETARGNQTRAVQNLAAAATRRADAESAQTRFDQVRGETNCYFCGQILTPEHAQNEVLRLETALISTKNEEELARVALDASKEELQSAQNQLKSAQTKLQNLEKAQGKSNFEAKNANASADNSRENATAMLRELNADFAARFDGKNSREWNDSRVSIALQSDFPTPETIQKMQLEAQNIAKWQSQARDSTKNEAAQREIAARARDRKNQLQPLRANLNDAALLELQSRETALQNELKNAANELESGAIAVQKVRDTTRALQELLEIARLEIANLENHLSAFRAAEIEIARALEAAKIPLLSAFFELSNDEFRAEFSRLQNQKTQLESGDLRARIVALRQSQSKIADLEMEVSGLENSSQNVPQNARCAPELLQNQAQNFKIEIEAGETQRRELQLEKSELERQRESKKRLETAHLDAQNAARHHKTLADLLGPHQLQRHLLREAENGIVDEANAVLDRISSGTLRLELRADDEEIAGARKTAPKVLDIAVFRADDGAEGAARDFVSRGQGMLPAFLSGSQRFRVAVALALGIGRYATRGGGTRLEAVIIDEGFGALDKIGRGEMIDELKMLGQELKRVILVSHQEEFAEAFSNRYLIENDGVSSTARLMVF